MKKHYFNKQTKRYMQHKAFISKAHKLLEYTAIAFLGYAALVLITI